MIAVLCCVWLKAMISSAASGNLILEKHQSSHNKMLSEIQCQTPVSLDDFEKASSFIPDTCAKLQGWRTIAECCQFRSCAPVFKATSFC